MAAVGVDVQVGVRGVFGAGVGQQMGQDLRLGRVKDRCLSVVGEKERAVRSTSVVIESPDGRRRTVELRKERVSVVRASPTSNPDIVAQIKDEAMPEDCPRVECDWVGVRVFRRVDGLRSEVVGLRPKAYQLVRYMTGLSERNHGAPVVCTYEELITALWGEPHEWPPGRSFTKEDVRDVVNDARARLELDKARPRLLETVRGTGYRLTAWVERPVRQVTSFHDVDIPPMEGSPPSG